MRVESPQTNIDVIGCHIYYLRIFDVSGTKFVVFRWNFSPDTPKLGGYFKNPLGSGGVPEGIFKVPERARGSGPKSTKIKPEFCAYFFISCTAGTEFLKNKL